jgi:uncharacterized protein (TIGR00661 family)
MKILYAIQGTGTGHICRAREIIPLLQKKCRTDILISGYPSDLKLPFDVKYRLNGFDLIAGKKGGIDFRKTYKKANIKKFLNEVQILPVHEYDFVVNDFEPISAWACYKNRIPCIALSHQASLLDKNVPKPRLKNYLANFILRNYAPASYYMGLHFSRYSNKIFTPIIRKEIRESIKSDCGHYTVYLPAYDDKTLIDILERIPEISWQVFSRNCKTPFIVNNISIEPEDNHSFVQSLVTSSGVLCGAGFETPAEALFLGKKLMVVSAENQYEQPFNAEALKNLGVPVIRKLKSSKVDLLEEWVEKDYKIEITYPDCTGRIINRMFELFVEGKFPRTTWQEKFRLTPQ